MKLLERITYCAELEQAARRRGPVEQAGRRHGHPEQRAPRAGRLAPLEEEPLAGPVPLLDLADGRPPQQAVDRRRQADALSPEAAAALGYDFQPQWIAKTSRGASLQFNNRTDANVVMKKVDGNNELHEVDGQNPEPMEIGIAKETLVKKDKLSYKLLGVWGD